MTNSCGLGTQAGATPPGTARPNIFTAAPTGSMDPGRWAATVEFVSAAHGLAPVEPESVYRPALAGVPAL